jgi:SET domain-containing protein
MKIFKFKSPKVNFKCNLKCTQCKAKTKKNTLCKSIACIGVRKCWRHLLQNNQLRIKTSSIPEAGKGLYALNPSKSGNAIIFKKDDLIVKYEGEILSVKQLDKRYNDYTAPYTLQIKRNRYSDAACFRGVASLANTNAKSKINAKFYREGDDAFLYAVKPIRNGEEIFADYGSEYILNEPNVLYSTR